MRFAWLAILLCPLPAFAAKALEVRVGERSCANHYAKLKSPYKKILAASAGVHAAGLSAYVALQPEPKKPLAKKPTKSAIEKYFSKEEDLPLSRLLSRETIVEKAQDNLLSAKKKRGHKYSYGELLIQSEIRSKEPPDLTLLTQALRRYKKDQTVLKRIYNDSKLKQLEKIEKAVSYLHQNFFRHYCRDYGNLTNFFAKEKCGNCQSNTKLVLAHLQDAGLYPPQDFQLGAQLYTDHIAPVLIEKKTKRVLDLVTNKEQAAPSAPVYDPALLFHGLLTNMGVKPEATYADLLIADASDAAAGEPSGPMTGKIDSNTDFTGGKGSFGNGQPIPESTEMGREGMSQSFLGRERAPERPQIKIDFSALKLVVEAKRDDSDYDLTVDASDKEITASAKIAALCKEELSQLTFESYQKCQDKRSHQRIDKKLATPAGQLLQKFAQHPEKAATYRAEDLKAMADLLDEMNAEQREVLTHNYTRQYMMTPHPLLTRIFEMISNLDEKLQNDPITFLNFLDNLPKEKRVSVGRLFSKPPWRELYPFLEESSSYINDYDHEGYKALRTLLFKDEEMFLYQPKTALGPKDMVLYLDGDIKSGYVGQFHQPEGHEDTLVSPKEKEKDPGGKIGSSKEHGGVDAEVETKLRLAPTTVAALIPFLSSTDESPSSYANFPDGKSGAAKYFTPAVVQAFDEANPGRHAFDRYEALAKQYFDFSQYDIRDDSDASPRFFQLFGKEKFYYPFNETRMNDTNDMLTGDRFGGPFPEALAKYILKEHKNQMKSWDKNDPDSKGYKQIFGLEPYDEPIIREQDIPEENPPEEEPDTSEGNSEQ
ncbi:MAG: hypothetical protein AB7K68_14905 [Bacteriovoracia bacterium]